MNLRTLGVVVAVVAVAAGCGGDDGDDGDAAADPVDNDASCLDAPEGDVPRVEWIDPAMSVVEDRDGRVPAFFEVSADRQRVSLIVATPDGEAEQSFYCGEAGYAPPVSLGEADGATFGADDVDVDPDRVFSGIQSELDDPEIVDFVVQGGPNGVVYDARVLSDAGGVILVLLGGDGEILAVQALGS